MKYLENKLFKLYNGQGFFSRLHIKIRYLRGRLWELEKFIPKDGKILDLGCGHGVFANLLAITSDKRDILGVDISQSKIDTAKTTIGKRMNINFKACDITSLDLHDEFDAVTVMDVFYLIPFSLQKLILEKIYKLLKNDGVLVINEVCREKSLRFLMALLQENISVRIIKITKGNDFDFRTSAEWSSLIEDAGFTVTRFKRKTFNPATLFICRKQGDSGKQ